MVAHITGASCPRRHWRPGSGEGPMVSHRALIQLISRPVSRVLYGSPQSERDGHSSATPLARRLKQPTRTADPDRSGSCEPRRSYSVLLPVGFAVPSTLPPTRCALTAPFHPCLRTGGSFSVALSLGLHPPDVIRHRLSMEPGLSSPATFRWLPERPSSRLTG